MNKNFRAATALLAILLAGASRAGAQAPAVISAVPSQGYQDSVVRMRLQGTNIEAGAGVQLVRDGQLSISASAVSVVPPNTINSATFNLGSAALGLWDIRITNPGGLYGTLAGGFEVQNLPAVSSGSFTRFDGAVFDGGRDDHVKSVVLDTVTAGGPFVYVAGDSSNGRDVDLFILKYSSTGVVLSTAIYDAGANEYGRGIAFDQAAGLIYAAGYTDAGNSDYLVLKYDAALNLLGSAAFDSGGQDQANAVAVNSRGEVFVTGQSSSPVTVSWDMLTVKYSSALVYLSSITYDGGEDDRGQALAASGEDVFVAGEGSGYFLTVKYNRSFVYLGVGGYIDGEDHEVLGLAVDKWGEVYLAGSCRQWKGYWEDSNVLIKAGQTLGPAIATTNISIPRGIAVHPVTGVPYLLEEKRNAAGSFDYFITGFSPKAYNPFGQIVEGGAIRYDSAMNDYARAIAMDGSGNIFAAGEFGNGLNQDIRVINARLIYEKTAPQISGGQLTPAKGGVLSDYYFRMDYSDLLNVPPALGNPSVLVKDRWDREVAGSPFELSPVSALDLNYADGKAYAVSIKLPSGLYTHEFVTEDFYGKSAAGAWTPGPEITREGFGGNFSEINGAVYEGGADDEPAALAVDTVTAGGPYFYAAGRSRWANDDCFILRYSSSGEVLDFALFDDKMGRNESCRGLAVDPAGGRVYAAGYTSAEKNDYLLLKYDLALGFISSVTYNSGSDDRAYAVALAPGGGVYVAGKSNGLGSATWDILTIKYDSALAMVSSASYAGDGLGSDSADGLAYNYADNMLLVGGRTFTQDSGLTSTILKYGPDLNFIGALQYGAPPDSEMVMARAESGNSLYFSHRGAVQIVKYDFGSALFSSWAATAPVQALAFEPVASRLYAVGDSTNPYNATADSYFSRYSAAGAHLATVYYDSGKQDYPRALAADGGGRVLAAIQSKTGLNGDTRTLDTGLTFAKEAPGLSGLANPVSGGIFNKFSYQAVYTSSGNIPPAAGHPMVYIDTQTFAMRQIDALDLNYADGKAYVYETFLALGSHSYKFAAADMLRGSTITLQVAGPVVSIGEAQGDFSSFDGAVFDAGINSEVTALAVDTVTTGGPYIYVVGYSSVPASGDRDCFALKYNSTGSLAGSAAFDSGADDYCRGARLDIAANAFFVGVGTTPSSDVFTLRYDLDLVFVSSAVVPSGLEPTGLTATDPGGDVYTAAAAVNPYNSSEDYIIERAPGGADSTVYYDSGEGDDIPRAIVTDSSGNIYVSGLTWVNGTRYVRTLNAKKLFDRPIGRPPFLPWTGETNYIFGGVSPMNGLPSASYIYRVEYLDLANVPPAEGYPKVYIDGAPFSMSADNAYDEDYTDGKIYSFTRAGLPAGERGYRFELYDRYRNLAVGPATLASSGPIVGGALAQGQFEFPDGAQIDGGGDDAGRAITVDTVSAGGPFVYVAGYLNNADVSKRNALLLKYDSFGALVSSASYNYRYWDTQIDESCLHQGDWCNVYAALGCDCWDEACLTSATGCQAFWDTACLATKPEFSQCGPGWKYYDSEFSGVALDRQNQVYTCGLDGAASPIRNSPPFQLAQKYDSNLRLVYNRYFSQQVQESMGMALNPESGEIYAVARQSTQGTFLSRLSPGLELLTYRELADIYSVAVDTRGYAYITGTGLNGADYDARILKMDPALGLIYARSYGRGSGEDRGRGLAFDLEAPGGPVMYLAARSFNGTDSDYWVVKADLDGNVLSSAAYDSGGEDDPYAIAVDKTGNVYVTGRSTGTGSVNSDGPNYDYLTVKFDAGLVFRGAHSYNGTGNADDIAYGVAVLGAGDVYVTGASSNTAGNTDVTTLKAFAFENSPPVLAALGQLTPGAGNTGTKFIYKLKYTDPDANPPAAGRPLLHILSAGSEIAGSPFAMAFTSGSYRGGAVYTLEKQLPAGHDYSYFFAAADDSGSAVIVTTPAAGPRLYFSSGDFSKPEGAYYDGGSTDTAAGLAVYEAAAEGPYVYVTGESRNTVSRDINLLKYDKYGALAASARFDSGADDAASAVCVDTHGYVYALGSSYAADWDFTLLKYGPGLVFLSSASYDSGGADISSAVVCANGYIYAAGEAQSGGGSDLLTLKYDSGLNLLRQNLKPRAPGHDETAYAVTADSMGYVYLGGRVNNGADQDYLLVKYDPLLVILSSSAYDAGAGDEVRGLGFFPGQETLYACGMSGGNFMAAVYGRDLVVQSSRTYARPAEQLRSCAPDGQAGLLLAGSAGLLKLDGGLVQTASFTYTPGFSPGRAAAGDFGAVYLTGAVGGAGDINTVKLSLASAIRKTLLQAARGNVRFTVELPAGALPEDAIVSVSTEIPAGDGGLSRLTPTSIGLRIEASRPYNESKETLLTVTYADADVAGYLEKYLLVGRYENSRWVALPSEVFPQENKIIARLNHFSHFAVLQAAPPKDLGKVYTYPNPYKPGSGGAYDDSSKGEGIVFANLTENSHIKIFDLSGELVWEGEAAGPEYLWGGRNKSGKKAGTGIYIYHVSNPADTRQKVVNRLAIIR